MFCDIKDRMQSDAVKHILAACVFDASPAVLQKKIERYQTYPELQCYGYIKDKQILGVVGFEVHETRLEILHIAVHENARGTGIGGAMVSALQSRYRLPIEAETDDDAIGFYRKCGFLETPIRKYGVTRYLCTLPPKMTLLYGTSNPGKLTVMREYLHGLNLEILGMGDLDIDMPAVCENRNDPLENARIKATAFYQATGLPCFSCDSGLYFQDVPDALQPGVHVRRVDGKILSDDEMTAYYAGLAARFGGFLRAQYKNAICLVLNEKERYEHMGTDIAGREFILASVPHPKRTPGFPLDPLTIGPDSGKYYYDLKKKKDPLSISQGFRAFFKRALGLS